MNKILILLATLISLNAEAQSPWFFGSDAAVNLTNAIQYKNGVKNISGALNPTVTAVDAPAGSLYESTLTATLYVKQDAGSSTNWTALSPAASGTANTFAGFDSTGALFSIPTWSIVDYIDGIASSMSTDGTTQANIQKLYFGTTLGDGVGGHIDDFSPLYTITGTAAGFDLGSFTGINTQFNVQNGATVGAVDMISAGFNGPITGNYRGVNLQAAGDIAGGSTLYYGSHGAGTLTNFSGMRLDTFSDITNSSGYVFVSQGTVSNQLEMVSISNNATVGGNYFSMNSTQNAAVTGTYTGINVGQSNTASADGAVLFQGNNQAPIGNFFTGLALTNSATVSGSGNITGANFNNSGSGTNLGSFTSVNNGVMTSNITHIDVQDTSVSTASTFTGLSINASGTYTNIKGINVNLSSATDAAGGSKVAANFDGGKIAGFYPFTTISSIPGLLDSGNNLIASFSVDSGSPITDTSVIAHNLLGLFTFNDDYSEDPGFHLGAASVGYVGNVGVAAGKTASKVSMTVGGASAPVGSSGTVTNAQVFDSRGYFSGGGTLVIGNMYHFRAEDGGCSLATNCWGISVDDVTADNFMAKSLQIGGTQAGLNSSTALKLGSKAALKWEPMTTVERDALTAAEGMVIYNLTTDTLDFYDGAAWVAVGSGAGDVFGPASSVDSQVALFDGITGKLLKASTATGVAKLTSGVLSASNVDLTSEVTGILPLANGGTNKNMTAAAGGVVYTDADSQEVSAVGTAGQVFVSNGASAPSFQDGFDLKLAISTKTANYTLLSTDSVIRGDATSGVITITLPAAAGISGRSYFLKKIDSSVNAVILDGNGAETIDGAANYSITDQYHSVRVISNGTGWDIL